MALRVPFFLGGLPSQLSTEASEVTFLATVVKVLSIYKVVAFVMTVVAFSTFELGIESI